MPRPRKKLAKAPVELPEQIRPYAFYRKHGAVARAVIGLGPTQIDEAIKEGKLPAPVAAYEGSKAQGWVGSQLIELQQRRLAQATKQTGITN